MAESSYRVDHNGALIFRPNATSVKMRKLEAKVDLQESMIKVLANKLGITYTDLMEEVNAND